MPLSQKEKERLRHEEGGEHKSSASSRKGKREFSIDLFLVPVATRKEGGQDTAKGKKERKRAGAIFERLSYTLRTGGQ